MTRGHPAGLLGLARDVRHRDVLREQVHAAVAEDRRVRADVDVVDDLQARDGVDRADRDQRSGEAVPVRVDLPLVGGDDRVLRGAAAGEEVDVAGRAEQRRRRRRSPC